MTVNTCTWIIGVMATVLVGLTLWMEAEPAPKTEIRIEPQTVWTSQDCPVEQRCI